jgi:hypothetical protein
VHVRGLYFTNVVIRCIRIPIIMYIHVYDKHTCTAGAVYIVKQSIHVTFSFVGVRSVYYDSPYSVGKVYVMCNFYHVCMG